MAAGIQVQNSTTSKNMKTKEEKAPVKSKTLHFVLEFQEELLGTASANPEVHREFIASKAPNAQSTEEEVAALGVEGVVEKGMTIFHKHEGKPFIFDYVIKGFCKDACSMLSRVPGTLSSKLKAHKKVIDGLIFPQPRRIMLQLPKGGAIGNNQRPLRAQTAQGERIALANSETVPAGTRIAFEMYLLDEGLESLVLEWFEYAKLRGFGAWRNASHGRACIISCNSKP
jgi:hypothetical protein